MPRTTNYIKINGESLKEELRKRGLTMVDASVECGYSKSYVKDCCKRGSAPSAVIKLLRHEYNIDPELYVCDSEGKQEEQKEHLDYEKLYQVIHDAVYTAVTEALKDEQINW